MITKPIRSTLLIEDNAGDARLLREMFREDSNTTELVHVGTMVEAEHHLSRHSVDVILLDLGLPDTDGLEGISRVARVAPRTPLWC